MRNDSRRQKKVSSLIKEIVSEILLNELQDPRIEGLVSVTRVKISPDLKNADIYLSIFGTEQNKQKMSFSAIVSATSHIQSLLAQRMRSRRCPSIRFHWDQQFKEALETMKLIDEVSADLEEKEDSVDPSQQ